MTDYRATPDQWAYQEHWAQEDGDAACLLELRDRVQSLEDDSWKQAESTSYCVDALVKRIEALEANSRREGKRLRPRIRSRRADPPASTLGA